MMPFRNYQIKDSKKVERKGFDSKRDQDISSASSSISIELKALDTGQFFLAS